jgi:hypothetical protein
MFFVLPISFSGTSRPQTKARGPMRPITGDSSSNFLIMAYILFSGGYAISTYLHRTLSTS